MAKCATSISLAVLVPLLAPTSAVAEPIRFTFTYEPFPGGCPTCQNYPGFSFSFVTPSFITTTGMFELPAPIAIGTDTITHAGTNIWRTWVFGNGLGESISDVSWGLGFDTLAFDFSEFSATSGYIEHPGTFSYDVQGQTRYLTPPQVSVSGTGTLNVSVVPEPGTLILVGTGALVAVERHRRRHRAHT